MIYMINNRCTSVFYFYDKFGSNISLQLGVAKQNKKLFSIMEKCQF